MKSRAEEIIKDKFVIEDDVLKIYIDDIQDLLDTLYQALLTDVIGEEKSWGMKDKGYVYNGGFHARYSLRAELRQKLAEFFGVSDSGNSDTETKDRISSETEEEK